jgi:hypothetical protein
LIVYPPERVDAAGKEDSVKDGMGDYRYGQIARPDKTD